MKICHYFEWEKYITGGHQQSVKNQRKIMKRNNIDYTTKIDYSADILHLNNMGPRSVYAAKKARRKGIPVIIHTHQTSKDLKNSFLFFNAVARVAKPYLKYAYSLGDLLICPSEFNKKDIQNYSDKPKKVISNGFDPDKIEGFEEFRGEYLERYDLDPPVVFNVGHVLRRKGLEDFVETAREMPDIDFVWFGYLNPLGEGSSSILQGRKTKKIVDNAPENCTFTGYIDDIRGAYAAGDIFFFPSRNENEGIALLEAMAAGKPLVIRDIETYSWLEHGENCLKADSNFKEQIQKLRNEELREELGENARESSHKFRLKNVGEELIKAYREVLEGS